MIKKRIFATVTMLALVASIVTPLIHVQPAEAASVGLKAPLPANSTSGNHVFFLRADPANGLQRNVRLSLYMPSNTPPGALSSSYVELSPGAALGPPQVCEVKSSVAPTSNFITVTISDPVNGANRTVTRIAHQVPNSPACSQANQVNTPGASSAGNVLYARYALPNRPANLDTGNTGLYKFDMEITYSDTNINQDAGGIRMVAIGGGRLTQIGQVGADNDNASDGFSFPLIGSWDNTTIFLPSTSLNIPLGLPCKYTSGSRTVTIKVYDADNNMPAGHPFELNTLRVKVKRLNGPYQDLFDPQSVSPTPPSTIIDSGKTFVSGGGNKAKASFKVTLDAIAKYQLEIIDLNPRNTIDIGLPYDSVYGDPNICNDCPNCPIPGEDVVVKSNIYGGGEVEVGSSVTFTQAASVVSGNFPTGKEQGWDEMAVRRAVNAQVPWNTGHYNTETRGPNGVNQAANKNIQCGGGAWQPSCPGGNYTCHNGDRPFPNCNSPVNRGGYKWKCEVNGNESGVVQSNSTNPNNVTCPAIYQHYCAKSGTEDTSKTYRDFTTNETNICDRYFCNAPSNEIKYDSPPNGAGFCQMFRCAYDPTGTPQYWPGNQDGNCALRCDNGAGSPAPYHSEGDERCYKAAAFTVTCTWEDGNFTSGIVTDNVTIYCQNPPNLTKSQSVPGLGRICATNNVTNSGWITGGGGGYLPPGKGKGNDPNEYRKDWRIVINQAQETCAKVGLKPYFHVYGGDVNATASFSPCTTPNATTVNSYNVGTSPNSSGGNFTGSGSQLAIFARGAISEFVSDSQDGPLPKSLTFGNTNAAGLPWGGNLSDLTCIPNDEWDKITAPAGSMTIDLGFNDPDLTTVGPGANQKTAYVNGDVYITGPISYPQPFSLSDVPSLKIVTTGNIFIQGSIPEISGTFMAKQKIYTCAAYGGSGLIAPAPEQMAQVCRTPLKIYGSFIADQVKLLRTAGSRYYSVANPMSVLNSTDPGVPAELFLYTPDNWVRSLDSNTSGTPQSTQSILNLPPIL